MRISDWSSDVCSSDLRPLLVQFRRILDRGASQRVFAANIDVEKFFAADFSLTTTCFLTGRVMSEYLPIDPQSSAGMSDWEDYDIRLLFASIRPQLSRSEERSEGKGCVRKWGSRGVL